MPTREPAESRRAPPAGLRSRKFPAPGKFTQSGFAAPSGAMTRYWAVTVFAPARARVAHADRHRPLGRQDRDVAPRLRRARPRRWSGCPSTARRRCAAPSLRLWVIVERKKLSSACHSIRPTPCQPPVWVTVNWVSTDHSLAERGQVLAEEVDRADRGRPRSRRRSRSRSSAASAGRSPPSAPSTPVVGVPPLRVCRSQRLSSAVPLNSSERGNVQSTDDREAHALRSRTCCPTCRWRGTRRSRSRSRRTACDDLLGEAPRRRSRPWSRSPPG